MKFDEINYWSEIKLDIIKEYAQAYSTIISAQKNFNLYHIYIDAFSGAGVHYSKDKKEFVLGSPLNALNISPRFKEYHLIDLNQAKSDHLSSLTKDEKDVFVYNGDCNSILLQRVFPKCLYKNYRRALCLLDPYGLHLNWEVIKAAGEMKSIEIFLNFPVTDMNRNVFWSNPNNVDACQIDRMNAYWGDDSWRKAAYDTTCNFFGFEEKTTNQAIAYAFQKRLKDVAKFKFVPDPIPMRNSKSAIIYYLFFASQNQTGHDIIQDIFNKYRDRGVV
jgi:three-Cys-motif partner protein